MTRSNRLLAAVFLAALWVCAPARAWAIVDLGAYAPAGFAYTSAEGINDQGKVFGVMATEFADEAMRANFFWAPGSGVLTPLGSPASGKAAAVAIDALGHIAGTLRLSGVVPPASGPWRGFVSGINGTPLTSVGTFGGLATHVYAMTPDGQRRVVGHTVWPDGTHANQLFRSGPGGAPLQALAQPPGGTGCVTRQAAADGRLAGTCNCNTTCRAFTMRIDGSGALLLTVPPHPAVPSPWSQALGVNASNRIVGRFQAAPSQTAGIMWTVGAAGVSARVLSFPPGGAPIATAFRINASGAIVGYAYPLPDTTKQRAVLWPSASSLPLVLDTLPEVIAAGWTRLEIAHDINASGAIVGRGYRAGFQQPRAFLLVP